MLKCFTILPKIVKNVSGIDIGVVSGFLHENQVNQKPTILDILFIVVYLTQLYRDSSTL